MASSSPAPAAIALVTDGGTSPVHRLLAAAGYRVVSEAEGADAIVVDVDDRGRAAELRRSLAAGSKTPVLVVGPADLPAHDRAGADEALARPVDPVALVARVTALIGSRRLIQQLEHAGDDGVGLLTRALEEKDDHTEGHGGRVAVYGAALAEYVGLSAPDVEAIRVGGLLHDLGKLWTPDALLNEPRPLTPEEFELVKRHSVDGWELARHVAGIPDTALDCVRHHHEKLDGSGYPDGLQGAELSVPARIAAVVTVFDALVTSRAYKPAFPEATSFRVLREEVERGWWDGELVEALIALLRERGLGGEEPPRPPRPGPGRGPAGVPARLGPTDPPRVPPRPGARGLERGDQPT